MTDSRAIATHKRNATIVRLRKDGYTLRELSETYGVSSARIAQIVDKDRAKNDLEKLRQAMGLRV